MKRNWLLLTLAVAITINASAQTLFTYGKYKVDASEFIRAFNRNNQQTAGDKQKAMREYLDLYINSRLKIRQAYDMGLDTLPQLKSEVEGLRSQVIETYMSDPNAVSRLAKEAFVRSQKDIHLGYIFIHNDAHTDSAAAAQKLNTVLKKLESGEDFLSVAQQLSDDPAAKQTRGDLNYITVFTLPYEFENIVYASPVGKYSKPYRTADGYHIFKNIEERKALGKIKIQQILLALPPGTDEAGKKTYARLADSLYKRIVAGDDFGKLAVAFSNDNVSAASNGNVPEISVGQYDASFEKVIWALPKDGAISQPFLTNYGYHIVKRIALNPIVSDSNNIENMEQLREKVMRDSRWNTAKDFIYAIVKTKAGFQRSNYNDAVLWALSDSLLDYKPAGPGRTMSTSSSLFKIGKTDYKVADWIKYAQMNRYKRDGSGTKPYHELMDEFIKTSMQLYYRDHLEELNDDFRNQMNEFREGNLFFEVMQREVWNKTQTDSAALKSLYEKNKSNYNWKESADAVVFFCTDEAAAKSLAEQLKKNPADWKKISDAMNEKIVADSNRYEWSQIPGFAENTKPKQGSLTSIVVNTTDNSASFAYILKVHTGSSPRTFEEAKGLVMNDYQTVLETKWIDALKKKYPVKVDQKVLENVLKK